MSSKSSRRVKSAAKPKPAEVEDFPSLPPLAHVHFQGDRHLHPQRLPSAKREIPVSIRLLDTKPPTVESVTKIGHSLKRVTISGVKLTTVPSALLDCLSFLEKLDLSNNRLHDAGIPDDFTSMDHLVELTLSNNKIARTPACLKKMKNLTRLDLSHNKLDSLKGIDKLKRLHILVVEHNVLTTVIRDTNQLKKLETLCCAHNNIREVSPDIRHMRSLKEIDFSNNKISLLIPELFLLPRLEVLNISGNKIAKVPSFAIKLLSRHWLQHVDLSENSIVRFPEHLLLIVKKLDVSSNKIKVVLSNIIKKMDWNTDQELIVNNNPITYPPVDVCNSGLRSIVQFVQEVRTKSKVHQGVKVNVIGSEKSGKSSLVQSLLDQQARIDETSLPSCGIDCYEASLGQSTDGEIEGSALHLCLVDFGGHPTYLYPNSIFLDQSAVMMVVFNMAEFSVESFNEMIGSWFDWIISSENKLVAVVVGTQSDRLDPKEVERVKKTAESAIKTYIRQHKKRYEAEIMRIEARPHISATYSELLKNYVSLLNARVRVHPHIVVTSSATYSGFKELHNAITSVAEDKNLFPNFRREIPTFWIDVEHFLEDKGNFMSIPVMTWQDYEDLVNKKFGMKHLLTAITQYLHESGKVLWFSKISGLKNHVFLRPSWLFEVFRYVFRHDLDTEDGCPYDWLKRVGLSPSKIDRSRKELLEEGIAERDFLKGMLGGCVPHDLNLPFLQVLTLLTEGFEIGYPVQRKMKEGAYNFTAEADSEGKVKLARVLLPWYRKTSKPEPLTDLCRLQQNSPKVVVMYNFHIHMPPSAFNTYVVRLNNPGKYPLQVLSHWADGVHIQHNVEPVQILLTQTVTKERSVMVKFDVTYVGNDDVSVAKTIWDVLMPLLMMFEELLQAFSGCWVTRHTFCPLCHEPSFIGEWMSPKETQGLRFRACERCQEGVETCFLVPPKEKKRDEVKNRRARMSSRRSSRAGQMTSQSDELKKALSQTMILNGRIPDVIS